MTLLLLVTVPLATAMLIGVGRSRLGARRASALLAVAACFTFGIALALAQAFAAGRTSLVADVGPWLPIRGSVIGLRALPFEVPTILWITAVAALIAIGALGAHARVGAPARVGAFALLAAGALITALAHDLILLAAGWQLVGLAASRLALEEGERAVQARRGARAFIAGRIADWALLLGVVALSVLFRTADIDEIAARLSQALPAPEARTSLLPASALVLGSILVRSAMPPFHGWLLDRPAHPAGAAAMQTIAVGSGAVVLLRLAPILDPTVVWGAALVAAGAALIAGVAALLARGPERALGWATVMQVGLVVAAAGGGFVHAALYALAVHAFARTALLFAGDVTTRWVRGVARVGASLALWALLPLGGELAALPALVAFLSGLGFARGGTDAVLSSPMPTAEGRVRRRTTSVVALAGAAAAVGMVVGVASGVLQLGVAVPAGGVAGIATNTALGATAALAWLAVRRRSGLRRPPAAELIGVRARALQARTLPIGAVLLEAPAALLDRHVERVIGRALAALAMGVDRLGEAARPGARRRAAADALALASLVALLWYWGHG